MKRAIVAVFGSMPLQEAQVPSQISCKCKMCAADTVCNTTQSWLLAPSVQADPQSAVRRCERVGDLRMQEVHQSCHYALSECLTAMDDRGGSWLRLGFGKEILDVLLSLPIEQAEMRVRQLCIYCCCCCSQVSHRTCVLVLFVSYRSFSRPTCACICGGQIFVWCYRCS